LPERDLLPYLLQRENYESFFPYVDLGHIKDSFKELHYLYQAVRSLREEYPDRDFDVPALQAYFFHKYPDADKEIYLELFRTLQETPLDPELGVGILKDIKRRRTASSLSEEAFKYATGHAKIEGVLELAKKLEEDRVEDSEEVEVISDDLEFLIADAIQRPGLRWRLNCLNRSLGSLRKGDFGFLFARPETGKTTFLASEVSYMLTQLAADVGPIIWFNNEEQGKKVMLRAYQGYFGLRLEQLMANPTRYNREFHEQARSKLQLVDNAGLNRLQAEKICKQLKPSLILFDQIDKVKGFAADREDLRLGSIYVWGRELAKEYCPVIGVCQADGTAEGQKWLTMEHVSNAKTSKQAEADWILGIGKTYAEGAENVRYLNISKNKLMGDEDSIPDLRHGRFEVYIEAEIARYRDIVRYD
jgi:replicative DNA helicase